MQKEGNRTYRPQQENQVQCVSDITSKVPLLVLPVLKIIRKWGVQQKDLYALGMEHSGVREVLFL